MGTIGQGGKRPRGTLLRVLGVGFGLAVTIGNTVGAGILRTPGEIAAQLPNAAIFLAVWLAGGAYALLGALTVSELGAMMPRSGGYYVFARRAFGDFPAFVFGWTDWFAQAGTISGASIVVGECAGELFPALRGHHVAIAVATASGIALLQARGIRWGAALQNASSAAKALLFLVLLVAFFALTPGAAPDTSPAPRATGASTIPLATAVVLALQAVIYTYDGWYGIIYFGEEVREPGRDVPRSMIGGAVSIIALYLLVNLALVHVLSLSGIAGETVAVGTAAARIFGEHGGDLVRVVAIVSMISAITAFQLMTSRIPVAMSRDGLLPASISEINAGGTPTMGLLSSTGIAVLFILTGSFQKVTALMAFFFVSNYVMAFVTIFVLRRREPDAPRPYRAWGHPFTTGLALLVSVVFLAGAVSDDTRNSVHSLLILASSYPVYRVLRRFGGAWSVHAR
ncbi:APC family permease [Pendulispora albinea]|uniref:APC family permease n=1 Tax=Pendulispora albinea TaxID=2741071 RepID=A0ABZ2LZZ9_9BACT